MNDQQQSAVDGGIAVQSGRNTTIYTGISPSDMRQIMTAIADQVLAFSELSRATMNERLAEFKEEILNRFAEPGKAEPEAFKDPDFQYVLANAQYGYARSGDSKLLGNLVDIIANRSKHKGRTRLVLSLNQAVERASQLTDNEFALLSFCYILRYTRKANIVNIEMFYKYVKESLMPFVSELPTEESSFSYLESLSCAKVSIGQVSLAQILHLSYGGLFGEGFSINELNAYLKEDQINNLQEKKLIIPCLNNKDKFQPSAMVKDVFIGMGLRHGFDVNLFEKIWTLFQNNMQSKDKICEKHKAMLPELDNIFRLWDETQLKSLELTSVGMAIGHANAVRAIGFDSELSVWIR